MNLLWKVSLCSDKIKIIIMYDIPEIVRHGVLPKDWSTVKKGKKTDKSNYRPVSLTPVPCKIMESIIKEKLLVHLESNQLLQDAQHGFTHGRSCLTNLLETLESWTNALDEGFGLDVIYLDYRKAFDSVLHKRMIAKLKTFGITGKTLTWLKSFLADRTMRVGIRGTFSHDDPVTSGVPKGSVIGPLLFILYVNELPDWIKNEIKMFVDDTMILCKIKTVKDAESLQADLNDLMEWSRRWQMAFNSDKCKVMHIGHRQDTKYYMSNQLKKYRRKETWESALHQI